LCAYSFELVGSCFPHIRQDVTINIECKRDACMTKTFADNLRIL
jgi:hypothetical protein